MHQNDFGEKELIDNVEKVIKEEMKAVNNVLAKIKPRTEGKTAMLFVGGSRAHHYQDLFRDMGMKVIAAGYEFAHRDDYEGRKVLPNLKVDADSRNIEELEVDPDPERYQPRKTPEELEACGVEFSGYRGMMPEMENGSLIIDDIISDLVSQFRGQCALVDLESDELARIGRYRFQREIVQVEIHLAVLQRIHGVHLARPLDPGRFIDAATEFEIGLVGRIGGQAGDRGVGDFHMRFECRRDGSIHEVTGKRLELNLVNLHRHGAFELQDQEVDHALQ